MKKYFITISLFLFSLVSFGCSKVLKNQQTSAKYVASTSWVAGIAELAGIDDVITIAPLNLSHPAEYEITPDDILTVKNAELIMHAGYERMVKVIAAATEVDESKMQKVKTTNTLENLSNMVKMLSEKAGTQEEAQKRFSEYTKFIEEIRIKIKETGLDKKTVYANVNQVEFARDIGLNVVATFGGGPLIADEIADAAENKYDLIIDNIHNPVASVAAEVSPTSKLLIWRNFPEIHEKNALYNVIKANCETLFQDE